MKRILSLALALLAACAMLVTVDAASAEARDAAESLNALGLFAGVGKNSDGSVNFDLDRAPARTEGVTMLVRLLGKESEALGGTWQTPFSDVPEWAEPYVGYAYANGLTNGVGDDGNGGMLFGSEQKVSAAQYLTFVLRSLGYESGRDFDWSRAWELTDRLGITDGRYNAASSDSFLRADVALVSLAAWRHANTGERTALTAMQISEQCAASVFYLDTYALNGSRSGNGSGFFISDDGLAVTNYHVVDGALAFEARTTDGSTTHNIDVIDCDRANDLALLRVRGVTAKGLPLSTAAVRQGETVCAIGSPLGLENTLSQGIVSNANRVLDDVAYIQISVPIAHGSSGGALINAYGEVVGVTSAGFADVPGDLNLAIPAARIAALDRRSQNVVQTYSEETYPGFDTVLDFGAFTGVELVDVEATALGCRLAYDIYDFHDLFGESASSRFANAVYAYGEVLTKQYGMEETRVATELCWYTNEDESVEVLLDFDGGTIWITAEFQPRYYAELPAVPDFGWYSGLELATDVTKYDGKYYQYMYYWPTDYTAAELIELVTNYGEILEREGLSYIGATDEAMLYEGRKLSVAIVFYDNFVCIDAGPMG